MGLSYVMCFINRKVRTEAATCSRHGRRPLARRPRERRLSRSQRPCRRADTKFRNCASLTAAFDAALAGLPYRRR
eukprot:scaffold20494_cov69-Phaeocystis_antarctica.AAC.4